MTISRRLFAAGPAAWIFGAREGRATKPRGITFAVEQGHAVLRGPQAGERPVRLPGERARLLAALTLAGGELAAVAFAARQPIASSAEMVAFVGTDGARLRVLGLERLRWRNAGGAGLASRISATTDGTRVRLERDAARPRPDLPPVHEVWIDYLRWSPGAALADAPIRPPVPGTCQAALAVTRARVAAALAEPCTQIGLAWLDDAGLLAAPF